MKTPPVLRTTFIKNHYKSAKCAWNSLPNSFASKFRKKTKLATTWCILRPFYLELRCKTLRDFHHCLSSISCSSGKRGTFWALHSMTKSVIFKSFTKCFNFFKTTIPHKCKRNCLIKRQFTIFKQIRVTQ